MERIVIVGCPGAGKSRLATELSRRTAIPALYLDLLFWRPGWTRAPQDEAVRALEAAIAGDRWIVEGDFLNAGDGRFARADAVVFLDRSRTTCVRRVLKRAVLGRRRARVDLPAGCDERVDLELLKWIWQYPRASRPRIVALLADVRGRAEVHHLRSDDDVSRGDGRDDGSVPEEISLVDCSSHQGSLVGTDRTVTIHVLHESRA